MEKIVQCVPNFSEGRDLEKIERIVEPLKNKEGFNLVSVEPDGDYNRTVVTLLGDPKSIIEALIPFVGKVEQEIDMNVQSGEHPRMGAVDVIPFIPIEGVTMEDCVAYAEEVGERINKEFSIPIFLYAEAARQKRRVKLPTIRKGEFEGMKEKIKDDKWAPDFGKAEIHPTFGVIGVGARNPLIAFNIDLDTKDQKIANKIAKAIRGSSGGFTYIQAGPAYLENRGHMQVTMNILDYKKNPIYRIVETVKMEAARYQVKVTSCEVVGLIPKDAIVRSLKYYAQCKNETLGDLSLEEVTKQAKTVLGFRDFDDLKIIEANL